MKGKKKMPFCEDYNMSKITIDNSASTTDCKGLAPSAQLDDFEHESYSDIVNFFPEDIVTREKK